MRLIDADELIEHAYRDRLDSRELIANMITSAPTIKEIPINIPLSLIVKALEQEPCEDAISRQAVLECFTWTNDKADIWNRIKELPPVTP